MSNYEEVLAEVDGVGTSVGEAAEPEEQWGYIDIAEAWELVWSTNTPAFQELITEALAKNRWGAMVSVPQAIADQYKAMAKDLKGSVLAYKLHNLLRSGSDEEKAKELYSQLRYLCDYDELAVARLLMAQRSPS